MRQGWLIGLLLAAALPGYAEEPTLVVSAVAGEAPTCSADGTCDDAGKETRTPSTVPGDTTTTTLPDQVALGEVEALQLEALALEQRVVAEREKAIQAEGRALQLEQRLYEVETERRQQRFDALVAEARQRYAVPNGYQLDLTRRRFAPPPSP